MPVSSEFVALCKAQIAILTQALGASISIVYLTQELAEEGQPQLVAIAAYPESLLERDRPTDLILSPAPVLSPEPGHSDTIDIETIGHAADESWLTALEQHSTEPSAIHPHLAESVSAGLAPASALMEQRQIVLPLVSEDHVLGLLVTQRDDRAWEAWEHSTVTDIAQTIAVACVLDQRYQWSQHEREQERMLQLQQHDLMDNLLHQFRNSLTALQTFGKLIMRRLTPGDRSHDLATSITRETDRLRDLAQQMELALETGLLQSPRSLPAAGSRAGLADQEQLGDATLEPRSPQRTTVGLLPSGRLVIERCLLETVLTPLLDSAQAIAQEKNLDLITHIPDDLPPIWANPKALREALNNLIENAIKYTPTGGRIWIGVNATETSPDLVVTLSDSGVGIPPEDLPHIFERHYRGVQAEGSIPGSGLGLAITRSLIEQMHGKIQVFSPALPTPPTPGTSVPEPVSSSGTTFVVHLPTAIYPLNEESVESNPDQMSG